MDGINILLATAAAVAVVHTAIGVDHTLPFVVLGRAQSWSLAKTLSITAACGLGHVTSSVVIGAVGLGLGVAIDRLEWLAGVRGSLAAWLLIGFGLGYASWAVWSRLRRRPHLHPHTHADGTHHVHEHTHQEHHAHPHGPSSLTAWSLFILFVFGPCESMIPLMMAPAALGDRWAVLAVVGVFGVVTITTMVALVALLTLGLRWRQPIALERNVHVVAGLTIAASGAAVQWLGL